MKLIVVSADFPFPASNGHRLRNWAILRSLAAEGHDVSLLTFVSPDEPSAWAIKEVSKICAEVLVVPLVLPKTSTVRAYFQALKTLFSRMPYSILRFHSPELMSQLSVLLESRRFDAVICETVYPLVSFPPNLGIPLILDNHNIEHVLIQRYRRYERNLFRRAYAEVEWRKLRNWENAAWRRAGKAIFCSEHDRALCTQSADGVTASVVPNIVDVDGYQPGPGGNGATILYVGGMDWLPNRDAVQHFAFHVLPRLRDRFPKLEFVVAGRGPGRAFRSQLEKIGVSFTGTVLDMHPVIAQADICVVPLRIGSGTRLKILEAAAMGKAIVSTTIGAEGLDFADGSEFLLADTEQEFVDSVSRLLNDPPYASSLGCAARLRVVNQYSQSSMRTAIRTVLADIPDEAHGSVAAGEDVRWRFSTF